MSAEKSKWWEYVRDPSLWLIMLGVGSGSAGAWPVLCIGAVTTGLFFSRIQKYLELHARARRVGAEDVWWGAVFELLALSFVMALGAYGAGAVVRFVAFG